MDPQKMKEVYERLEQLDDRLGHKLRGRGGPSRLSTEQLEDRMRDLAQYTTELRDIVRELVLVFARPPGGAR